MPSHNDIIEVNHIIERAIRVLIGHLSVRCSMQEISAICVCCEWALISIWVFDVWEEDDETMTGVHSQVFVVEIKLTSGSVHEVNQREFLTCVEWPSRVVAPNSGSKILILKFVDWVKNPVVEAISRSAVKEIVRSNEGSFLQQCLLYKGLNLQFLHIIKL